MENGPEQWVPLKEIKESTPVKLVEFSKSCRISDEREFCWYMPYVLRKRDQIIVVINSRVKKATHTSGVHVSRDLKGDKEIDKANGSKLYFDAIKTEIFNISVAFEILNEDEKAPPGLKPVSGRIIFDVEMDVTRKSRWVKDGNKIPDLDKSTYDGVVSRDSVRIIFAYAELDNVLVTAADINNAYLQALSSEKYYIICGVEFELEHIGKVSLI